MKTFISYKHESDAHKAWVNKLATDLELQGVECIFDQVHLKPSNSIIEFMQKIGKSKYFLFIVTPASKRAAERNKGNVSYELHYALTLHIQKKLKLIPIIREGSKLPQLLADILGVDFQSNDEYIQSLEKLVDAIVAPSSKRIDLTRLPATAQEKQSITSNAPFRKEKSSVQTLVPSAFEDLYSNVGASFRTRMTTSEITTWLPKNRDVNFYEPDDSQTFIAPPQLIETMLRILDSLPSTSYDAQHLSFALLKCECWDIKMEKPLLKLVSNQKSKRIDVVAIIIRLTKIADGKTFSLLKKIACQNIHKDYRYLAIVAIHRLGFLSGFLNDSGDCLKGLDEILIEDLIVYDDNKQTTSTSNYILNQKLVDLYISTAGHKIHKLKAKDTSGRWAYYFLYVRSEKEKAFLDAIDGDGTIDLEEFGEVIISNFGDKPTQEVKDHLKLKYGFQID